MCSSYGIGDILRFRPPNWVTLSGSLTSTREIDTHSIDSPDDTDKNVRSRRDHVGNFKAKPKGSCHKDRQIPHLFLYWGSWSKLEEGVWKGLHPKVSQKLSRRGPVSKSPARMASSPIHSCFIQGSICCFTCS